MPKGSAVHDPKTKENKERESGNMNSKGEIWKQTESQRWKDINAGIPHETNMKKGKERNSMNQNKRRKQKTKHNLEKLFFQDFLGRCNGTMGAASWYTGAMYRVHGCNQLVQRCN